MVQLKVFVHWFLHETPSSFGMRHLQVCQVVVTLDTVKSVTVTDSAVENDSRQMPKNLYQIWSISPASELLLQKALRH